MIDLQELLEKTHRSLGISQDKLKDKAQQARLIDSTEGLAALNGHSERIRKKMAQLKEDPIGLERLIGRNNLMDICYLQRGLEVARTTCRIVYLNNGEKEALGTGFLVGPGLLMSNQHVLRRPEIARLLHAEFGYESLGNGRLNDETLLFKLEPGSFFLADESLDFAICALASSAQGEPGQKIEQFGWNELSPVKDKLLEGQFLTIIQHPLGGRKMIAFRDNQLVDVHGRFIHYTTDTQQGSSGSLVASDEWDIVALHRSGVPEKDQQGNILLAKGGVWQSQSDDPYIQWIANQGVLIDAILENISSREPEGSEAGLKSYLLQAYQAEQQYQLPGKGQEGRHL